MSDRYTRRILDAITEGSELEPAIAEHLTGCAGCQAAAQRAMTFNRELDAALARRRTEPMPADPLLASPASRPRRWLTAAAGLVVVLLLVVSVGLGSQWLVAQPSPAGSPPPSASPSSAPSEGTAEIEPGTLARVNGAAAVLDVPAGTQWATLEPDHDVLVVDVRNERGMTWYRVEFEYCCAAGISSNEWVFGWVAGELEGAELVNPGWGIPSAPTDGPTLSPTGWSCPEAQELYRIPEPVRYRCYGTDPITITGVLSSGQPSEAMYPGDPAELANLASASLIPTGIRSGDPLMPIHVPPFPLLLAWLNDERVKNGDTVAVTGSFGPYAVACTKSPRLDGFPQMTPDEQQLWCDQQFTVSEIDAEGPDPIVEAPDAEPLWTPPAGVQPKSGDGWRLLASRTRNQLAVTVGSETVDYALDQETYRVLWFSLGHGEPPPIDFALEFVVRFVPPVSGSCPWIALTGIGVDSDEDVLHGEYEYLPADMFLEAVPGEHGCTSDATPHAFLVAVDRSLAPANQFRLRLRQDRLCDDCGITWDERVVRLDP
jgi:hypothetical protein